MTSKEVWAGLALMLLCGCSAHEPKFNQHEERITYFSADYADAGDYPDGAKWCARVSKDGAEWRAEVPSSRVGPDHVDDHFFGSEELALEWVRNNWCRNGLEAAHGK